MPGSKILRGRLPGPFYSIIAYVTPVQSQPIKVLRTGLARFNFNPALLFLES